MGDAKKSKCLKKSNLLVYQTPSGQRVERSQEECRGKVKIPICTPKPKTIKICTGAELRKMCPPSVCPEKIVKHSKFGFGKVLGFGLKSAVAAALVYITYDMGIWGTTDDTQQLYGAACTIFGGPRPKKNDKWDPPSCEAESELFSKPAHKPFGHCEDPPIQAEDSYLKFQSLWNRTITTVFHGIVNFPHNVMSKKDTSRLAEEKKGVECVSFSELNEGDKKLLNNVYK